jgi:hypothetical protein
MGTRLALAIVLMFATAAAVQAQQAGGPNRGLGSGTPDAVGTAGTTSKTPGAERTQTVPGGGIPMGAATQQDTSKPSDDPSNFDGGGRSKSR